MGNQYYDGDLSITDMTNPSGDPKATVATPAAPTKNIPEWQLNSSKYPSDFILNLHTIYGDNELDKRTLKLLKRTWKKNPNFIINAALQKKNAANDAALQEATTQALQNMKNITSKYWDDVHAMEDASAAQDEKDYMDAGYTYDINKGWTKPQELAPVLKPKVDWNARAAEKLGAGKTMDDVIALQTEMKNNMGIDLGKYGIDGKWGEDMDKAYEIYKLRKAEKTSSIPDYLLRPEEKTTEITMFGVNTPVTSETPTPEIEEKKDDFLYKKGADSYYSGATAETAFANIFREVHNRAYDATLVDDRKAFNSWTSKYYKDNGFNLFGNRYTTSNPELDAYIKRMLQYKYNNPAPNIYSPEYAAWELKYNQAKANKFMRSGGNINKFSNGGKQMNEQQMQEAFVQFLILDAQAQGIDIQSEEDMKAYVQQLGKEGLAAKQQEFMLRMQGTPSRKLGGHLAYLNKLKGNCPDGEEMVYMENGGRVCPKCVKKAKDGDKAKKIDPKKNAISDFKEKRKAVNPNDTVHVGGKPKSLTNANGTRVDNRFPAYTAKDYQNDKKTKDGQKRRMKADLVSSEKCGGKAKKNK